MVELDAAFKSRADKILEEISLLKNNGKESIVVAIDGRCASGKSTMSEYICDKLGAGLIHMDDFYLPLELRTEARFAIPGSNVHYERFAKEVIPKLRSGEAFEYATFICDKKILEGTRKVCASNIRIIEGAYSHHPYFDRYADLKVFSDVDSKTQIERIVGRNGEDKVQMFIEKWIPFEEEYIFSYDIMEDADLIV